MIWIDVDTAIEVPVNVCPLTDDTDFKTIESAVAYDAAGMALQWNFLTPGGVITQTAVTPTTGGVYDWAHLGAGMYKIEIPASGGGSINNDTEGFGWFTGSATGVLPWRGPTMGFRASGINDLLVENAYNSNRGLAGSALPDAAANAADGLFTRGTGAGQIDQTYSGTIDVNMYRAAGSTTGASGLDSLGQDYVGNGWIDANIMALNSLSNPAILLSEVYKGIGIPVVVSASPAPTRRLERARPRTSRGRPAAAPRSWRGPPPRSPATSRRRER